MMEYVGPAMGLLFTLENIIWINLGVFIGAIFSAIPGLTVILCVTLFLPVTYTMSAIPGMMFLLGIYCAGGYGGSVSAILINTPGTPHAAATMLDGYPLSQKGRTKAALKIALEASTFGGIFSALALLFLGPQVAKIAAQLGTAEYFMVCLFGLTIIAGHHLRLPGPADRLRGLRPHDRLRPLYLRQQPAVSGPGPGRVSDRPLCSGGNSEQG